MILLSWDLLGLWMKCCKDRRRKERVILRWHNAGFCCLVRAPCLMWAFYQSVFLLSPGFAWPLHQSPVLFLRILEKSQWMWDSQAGFLPKNCLDGETHQVQRDFFFVLFFTKLKLLLITKTTHTHTPKQRHYTHKTGCSLSSPCWSLVQSYHLCHFSLWPWLSPLQDFSSYC